jgi:hydrogenase maturation protease
VIGVGNAYRSDDGVGLAVAEHVRSLGAGVDVVLCEEEPSRLIEAWTDADLAIVVDAASSGAAPGTVRRFDASEQPVPSREFRGSTHAFGLGEAIELARALRRLPGRLVVYGVEGERFAAGQGLSAAVAAVVAPLAAQLLEEATCTSAR